MTLPKARVGALFVAGQVRYQLLLLVRSPIASFITLVIPLMLLVALSLVTPEMTLASLGGVRVAQFLTPAMASFAVLNAGFVNTVIGTALARDEGTLKRLRGTPLPAWAYFAGRFGAAALLAACSVAAVIGVGVGCFHAHVTAPGAGPFVIAAAAGLVVSFALGIALGGLVRSAEAALPLAYALMLPVSFVSEVFFPAPSEAHWLRSVAAALPVQPFAAAMERGFATTPAGLTVHQLLVLGLWTVGAALLGARSFSWQSGERLTAGRWRSRHRSVDATEEAPA